MNAKCLEQNTNESFIDFYICKISYKIRFNEVLVLNALDRNGFSMFNIRITNKKDVFGKFSENVEFTRDLSTYESIVKTHKWQDCTLFDNDVYIVEGIDEIRTKLKLGLGYIKLNNDVSNVKKKTENLFSLIVRSLNIENIKTDTSLRRMQVDNFNEEITSLFNAMPDLNILLYTNISNNERSNGNFIVFEDEILKNTIDHKIATLKDLRELFENLKFGYLSLQHDANETFMMIDRIISDLQSITDNFKTLYENITTKEVIYKTIRVLKFIAKFLHIQTDFDRLLLEMNVTNNEISDFNLATCNNNLRQLSRECLEYPTKENLKKLIHSEFCKGYNLKFVLKKYKDFITVLSQTSNGSSFSDLSLIDSCEIAVQEITNSLITQCGNQMNEINSWVRENPELTNVSIRKMINVMLLNHKQVLEAYKELTVID